MNSWVWRNTTQVCYGENAVSENLAKYINPGSKVIVTFGGGSIEKNGSKADVEKVLNELKCNVKWEGGIPANPEYARLVEILQVAREFKPDYLLALGGGSVVDGTKFILSAMELDPSLDPWDTVIVKKVFGKTAPKLVVVLTLPATGSEWNNGFVVSRRATMEKNSAFNILAYPTVSLLDPKYTMTLPKRQVANGLYDAMCHCIDLSMTGESIPMFNRFWYSVMKELVDVSAELMKPDGGSLEAHGRLMQAASFALNQVFGLGRTGCAGIHGIGHQLTALYGIDHGATLSIVTPVFHEVLFEERKTALAEAAEYVFGVRDGTQDEKARAFIAKIREWIRSIGLPLKVSEWQGAEIKPGDVDKLVPMVMASRGGAAFGYKQQVTEEVVRKVLQQVVE